MSINFSFLTEVISKSDKELVEDLDLVVSTVCNIVQAKTLKAWDGSLCISSIFLFLDMLSI